MHDIGTKVIVNAMIRKGYSDLRAMERCSRNARKNNEKLLFRILRTNRNTEYGKKYGFGDIRSVGEYRSRVPVSTFADYEDYISRMTENDEKDLITALPVIGYAKTTGTRGNQKNIPLTEPVLKTYTRYTVTRMLALADQYSREHNGSGIGASRAFFICPSFRDRLPNGLPCSNVAELVADRFAFVYRQALNVPLGKLFTFQEIDYRYICTRGALQDKDTLYIFAVFFKMVTDIIRYLEQNWEILVEDIEKGTISDIAMASPETKESLKKVIRPDPERAAELRKEFEKGFDETIFSRLWPKLSVISAIGTSTFEPYARFSRKYTGSIPFDLSTYGASEGLFAAADKLNSPDQLLICDSCYYEFVPVEDTDRSVILSLDELEVGNEYEIIITNQAGLYRYSCGDVIRVTGYKDDCPYIQFAYRKGQLLNLIGEKTSEAYMQDVVDAVAAESGSNIVNWAVTISTENVLSNYVLILETDDGMDLSGYSDFANDVLCSVNKRYGELVGFDFGKLEILNQRPGSHREWMDERIRNGASVVQVKPVRILDTPVKEEFFKSRLI